MTVSAAAGPRSSSPSLPPFLNLGENEEEEGGEAGLATLYRHAQRPPPASCVSMIQSANVIKREREEKQKGEISRENRERERGGAFSDDDSERRGEGCVEWSAT